MLACFLIRVRVKIRARVRVRVRVVFQVPVIVGFRSESVGGLGLVISVSRRSCTFKLE